MIVKVLIVGILVILALLSLVLGMLAAGDPEGRGGVYVLGGLVGFVALLAAAIAAGVWV